MSHVCYLCSCLVLFSSVFLVTFVPIESFISLQLPLLDDVLGFGTVLAKLRATGDGLGKVPELLAVLSVRNRNSRNNERLKTFLAKKGVNLS